MNDAFPGFQSVQMPVAGASIHARLGGKGPPLLLLHGFPQTHVMWARVAALLAGRFRLVIPDLPGYGHSTRAGDGPASMTKRQLAAQMVGLMAALGHARFHLAGHDRGGRVAYRLMLDHPQAVLRGVVLDILPTIAYWEAVDRAFMLRVYHWGFLAQPAPLPETLIGAAPDYYLEHTLASWTAAKNLSAFTPDALAAYRQNIRQNIGAMCDDYRAGAGADVDDDAADRAAGRRISNPLLVLWGGAGIARDAGTPLDVWGKWATDLRGQPLPCGHFMPEEAPEATAAALAGFLGDGA